ncbi:hypothetical protein CT676_12140 [Bradyrhizobium sp. MOS001]|nr:hypothetical protein CT676_12140 [Bradyrhizobium sp. MOS001]
MRTCWISGRRFARQREARRNERRCSYPPLEGEGRSREARAGWGDLSAQALFVAEGPSPHPATHSASLHA